MEFCSGASTPPPVSRAEQLIHGDNLHRSTFNLGVSPPRIEISAAMYLIFILLGSYVVGIITGLYKATERATVRSLLNYANNNNKLQK